MLGRVERQTIGFSQLNERLKAAGRHIKRGLLLYGSPGTGKTLTAMYLAHQMQGRTTLLLTGRGTLAAAVGAINDGEVYRFMTKPWDIDELREVLRQAASRAMKNRADLHISESAGERTARLAALEREHPGITQVVLAKTKNTLLAAPSGDSAHSSVEITASISSAPMPAAAMTSCLRRSASFQVSLVSV